MDADHHVSCDKELRWNVNVEPLFVQDQGVDTGSRKTGRKYKSLNSLFGGITAPCMAVLGDQKSGNNIEAPESLIRRIVREESGNGKGSTYNVTAQVNRRTLFDLVLEEGKVRRTVTGRNPFETV